MMKSDAATRVSRETEEDLLWAHLFTQLPPYTPKRETLELVQSFESRICKFFTLCLQSRPYFAAKFTKFLEANAHRKDFITANLSLFVDELRDALMPLFRKKRAVLSETGCYGNTVGMLTAGYTGLKGETDLMLVWTSLTTKNWAYLANVHAVLAL